MVTRQEIIDNSYRWPERSVPYSMSDYGSPTGHRQDCSGYVSMCLGLPTPGLSTVTLADVCTWIDPATLQPGDIIGNLGPGTEGANGHVQLFCGWDNGGLSISEQAGGMYGPWRHTVASMGWGYSAWRFNETVDDVAPVIDIDEEGIDMQAWIAQDANGIAVVWIDPIKGLVWENVGDSASIAGWNSAGVAGPFMVSNIGALGKPAGATTRTASATAVADPPAPEPDPVAVDGPETDASQR